MTVKFDHTYAAKVCNQVVDCVMHISKHSQHHTNQMQSLPMFPRSKSTERWLLKNELVISQVRNWAVLLRHLDAVKYMCYLFKPHQTQAWAELFGPTCLSSLAGSSCCSWLPSRVCVPKLFSVLAFTEPWLLVSPQCYPLYLLWTFFHFILLLDSISPILDWLSCFLSIDLWSSLPGLLE